MDRIRIGLRTENDRHLALSVGDMIMALSVSDMIMTILP